MASTCGTCWRQFPAGWQSREQHMKATGHEPPPFECNYCDRFFASQKAVNQHMDALNHWNITEYECDIESCSDAFSEEGDLREHEVTEHYYCDDCDQFFQDYNSIKHHRNSKIHRAANMPCPFCQKLYHSATGLVHHLERGSCPKAPLDRTKMYEAVQRRDPNGVLTKKLLTWSEASVVYEATELAYNEDEDAYQCYLCKKQFRSLQSLNQHLKSPVHQQDLYRCPNRSCKREFTTLAAVISHLESEACQFMRFEAVQSTTQRILDPTRMIQF
ncbi:c2H2-type zinc finger domain-containing protein [Sarocladium implicatum]|nr:c2H2-type zinc finger domain-containing protein [Sarocladium implicatum]